ncbi:MAG: hypothetical protein HC910_20525 [Spirulinaceae cyanobacterium SM2_1_0]|nr:hypothetical protein [Spirulinaceae cyanobacterium SM2_1_0]
MKTLIRAVRHTILAATCALAVGLTALPAFAGDPFRSSNPRPIGDRTEAAFDAIFQRGDYPAAREYLDVAREQEATEPLVYAMSASLAFNQGDMDALSRYAQQTRAAAEQLKASDELRGNLYLAVGSFMEGAHAFKTRGPVGAATKLQEVLRYLNAARAIDPNDPELNLMEGYMELLLAVNVPFANPEQAIAKFEANAAPSYLVNRGIAIAYRDLDRYDEALVYANRALSETPDNPEVMYLKAQILHEQGKFAGDREIVQQSVDLFNAALAKQAQLPANLPRQIDRERGIAQAWLNENV